MTIKFSFPLALSIAINLALTATAFALPEEALNTHSDGIIQKAIIDSNGNLDLLKNQFSTTSIPVLDALWSSRVDVVNGVCNSEQNDCRVLSIFQGKSNDHPVVMLPGFTGYRKLYLEQIYDLIQAGYGPVYISDFSGTGDSYKPELKPGESQPSINVFLQHNDKKISQNFIQKIGTVVTDKFSSLIQTTLGGLPIGVGYIPNFNDYENDINFIMAKAINDNPSHQILMTSLSASGLSVFLALAHQKKNPTWISHIDRIVLESPMVRVKGTDGFVPGFGMFVQIFAKLAEDVVGKIKVVNPSGAIQEFVDKALGNFNPDNIITHSKNRITLTDSLRVWNGHETLGATFGWGYEELTHQYSLEAFDSIPFLVDPLNQKTAAIASILSKYNIPITVVGSEGDSLVDTNATKQFLGDLVRDGDSSTFLCTFQTARHVIDQESDKYREPFLALLIDQKDHLLKPTYGAEPRNELLQCSKVAKPKEVQLDDDDYDSDNS